MNVFETIPLFYAALPASQQVSSEQPWFSLMNHLFVQESPQPVSFWRVKPGVDATSVPTG